MPELYIGNVSKQIHQFGYRVQERPGVITQVVPIGGQIRISPNGQRSDLSQMEIDYILSQHLIYGLVSVDNLDTIGPHDGLCYSIGKPFTADKLHEGMLYKERALGAIGRQLRTEAALAVNQQIEQTTGAPVRELEMSFAEQEPRGGYQHNDNSDHLAEGVRVTRNGTDPGSGWRQ